MPTPETNVTHIARRMISAKAEQFTESVIREMTRLALKHNAVNLSQGFPDFAAPEEVKEAARQAISDDINQYAITWGAKPLRDAVIEKFALTQHVTYDPEREITICCGSTEAMMSAMMAIINPGDEIVVFEPFYENYGPDAILSGASPRFVKMHPPANENSVWSFDDRELAASLISRAETSGYSALMVTVDSWTLGFRPMDLERGNFPQFRGYCMQNYYTDANFTKHLAKPPEEDQPAALAHYTKIFANPLSWEDLRWIRAQTKLPIAIKGIQHPDDARLAIDNGADVLYCTNHGGRQANSAVSTLQLLPGVVKAAGSTPVMFDSGVRNATDAIIALALGATAVGLGRPYAYALSYGGAESLTHYLRSFLAELDLCLAVCGFKDIATLKEAGVEEVINSRQLLPG